MRPKSRLRGSAQELKLQPGRSREFVFNPQEGKDNVTKAAVEGSDVHPQGTPPVSRFEPVLVWITL